MNEGSKGPFKVGSLVDAHGVYRYSGSAAPVNGVNGTLAGKASPGSTYHRTATGAVYANTGTKASPVWSQLGTVAALASAHLFVGNAGGAAADVALTGDVAITNAGVSSVTSVGGATAAEVGKAAGVTAGTVKASSNMVANAAKSVDVLQATASQSVGGTGVPGAAAVSTKVTKAVTGFLDATAKDVFTVTVPNAAHAAIIDLDLLGVLGAGGAIGAGEATMVARYQIVLARTAGVATVATVSAAIGGAEAHVAGGDAITSVVATVSAMAGAVGATQTFTIKVAITRSGAGATNHTLVASAVVLNQNASGVTLA